MQSVGNMDANLNIGGGSIRFHLDCSAIRTHCCTAIPPAYKINACVRTRTEVSARALWGSAYCGAIVGIAISRLRSSDLSPGNRKPLSNSKRQSQASKRFADRKAPPPSRPQTHLCKDYRIMCNAAPPPPAQSTPPPPPGYATATDMPGFFHATLSFI